MNRAVVVVFDFFTFWIGQLLGLLLIIILLVLVFKLIKGIGSINVYTREIAIKTEDMGELEKKIDEIRIALEERGYKVSTGERGILYRFFGIEMELYRITRPIPGIIFNLKLTPIIILVGLILLILYPVGWLVLIIYALLVYQKYREITDIVRGTVGLQYYS